MNIYQFYFSIILDVAPKFESGSPEFQLSTRCSYFADSSFLFLFCMRSVADVCYILYYPPLYLCCASTV